MTRLQTTLPRAYAPPGLLASAAVTTLNSNFQWANAADQKAIDAGKPPRDLSSISSDLMPDYTGAVCVLVPKLSPDEMAAAKNRFNFDTCTIESATSGNSYGLGIGVNDKGFGKSRTGRSATSRDINGLGNGVTISHHREPHLFAGTVQRRGEHVAIH